MCQLQYVEGSFVVFLVTIRSWRYNGVPDSTYVDSLWICCIHSTIRSPVVQRVAQTESCVTNLQHIVASGICA